MIKQLIIIPLLSYPLFAISLIDLVSMGVKNSTLVQKSRLDVDYAKAKQQESLAGEFGDIDLVGNYTRFNLPRTLAPLTPATMKDPVAASSVATTKDLFGTGISYSVALFTGFAQTKQVEIDALNINIAQSKVLLTKEQLAYNIRSLYLSILATKEMYLAQKSYVETLTTLNNQIAQEVLLGKKANIDLIKSQSDLQGNISYLEVIKSTITITKSSLATLVGIKEIKNLEPISVKVIKPNETLDNLLQSASTLNKIKIGKLSLQKAQKAIDKSKSTTLPQLSLSSYYGYNYGPNDSSNPNSGDWDNKNNWQVGLNAKWSLYDFGKRDAITQQAKIAQIKASLEDQQILLDLRNSLVEASQKRKQAFVTYQGNLRQLNLAKESEKIESVRYYNNVSTLNDLLYAKSQTNLATAKLIESKYNYQKGNYAMDYILEKGVK